ncbi:hypothetical protein, partial [Photobacterium leiognathi]|uniref:hypothetical protein n=1 Tax=Photobacterium leiognathi TaxID=553611 RepID=UPI0005BCE387
MFRASILLSVIFFLSSCDNSNNVNSVSVTDEKPVVEEKSTINGVVVANKVSGAEVEVYAVDDAGDVKELLNADEVFTDNEGSYLIPISDYTGQVLVVAKGGSYKDEATGLSIDLGQTELRAVTDVEENDGTDSAANTAVITPLTELSTQLMGDDLSASNVESVNAKVSEIFFGVADPDLITKVSPIISSDETAVDDEVKSNITNYNLILSGLSTLAEGGNPVEALEEIKNDIEVNDGGLSDDFKQNIVEGGLSVLESQGIEVELENTTILNISEEIKTNIEEKIERDFFSRKLPQNIEVKEGEIDIQALLLNAQLTSVFDFDFYIVNSEGGKSKITNFVMSSSNFITSSLLVELTDKETDAVKVEYVNFTVVEDVKTFTYQISDVNNNGLIPIDITQTSGSTVNFELKNVSKRTTELVKSDNRYFVKANQDGIAVIEVKAVGNTNVTLASFSFNVAQSDKFINVDWDINGDILTALYTKREGVRLVYDINNQTYSELTTLDVSTINLNDTLSIYYTNTDGIRLTNKRDIGFYSIVQGATLKRFNQLDKNTLNDTDFTSVLGLVVNENNVFYYQSLLLPGDQFSSIEALQGFINQADASLSSFNAIQQAAFDNEPLNITLDVLNNVNGLTVNSANLNEYQTAIAAESNIADVTALQNLIDNVDNSVVAFAEVQTAAVTSNASAITSSTLNDILGLSIIEANLADYQDEVAIRNNIANVAALQSLVNSVDASIVAFSRIQEAVTSGDVSAIKTSDFSDILHLEHVDIANESAYLAAIANATTMTDVETLSALLLVTNQAQRLLADVNGITEQTPLDLTQWQADAVLTNLQTTLSHLESYNREAMLRQPFSDIAMVQTMIEAVNASVAAFDKVSNAAGGNTNILTENDFTAILHLTHFVQENLVKYRDAIAAAVSVADVPALNALLLLTNQEQALLAAVNNITDTAPLALAAWQADMLLTNVMAEPNLSQYNTEALVRQPMVSMAQVQALIDDVNASVVAFNKLKAAVGGETNGISPSDFEAILHLDNYVPINVMEYLNAIAQASSLEDVAALNTVMALVNSEQDFLTLLNNITPQSPLSLAQWQTNGLLNSTQSQVYLNGYNDEVLNRQPLTSIEAAQALVNEVNANIDAYAALTEAVTLNNANAISSDTFYALLGLDPALVIPDNLAAYQDELIQSASTDIDELSDVASFLTKVNHSETALAQVNLLLSQNRAFDLDDVLLLKILALEDSYVTAHHPAYQLALANLLPDSLPISALSIQAVLQETNNSQTSLANLRLAITNGVNIGDAIAQVRTYLTGLLTRADTEYQGAFNRLMMRIEERGSTFNTTYFDSIDGQLVAVNPADNIFFYVVKNTIHPIAVTVTYSNALGQNVFAINGEERPVLSLDAGNTYVFDQSDISNANHPIEFTSTAGDFTVKSTGIPGTDGASTEVTIGAENTDLSYFCTLHGAGMGNAIELGDPTLTLTVNSALTELGVTAVIDTQSGVTVNGQAVRLTQHRDAAGYDYLSDRGFTEPATETNRSLAQLTVQNLDHVMQMISVHIDAIENINSALSSDVTNITLNDLNRLVTVTNAQPASLSGYHQAMLDNNLVSIIDGSELQGIINQVNGDDALISLVNNAIVNNITLTQTEWQTGAILTDVRADGYLDAYQRYLIEHPTFTRADDIQTFINGVNNSVDSLTIISAAADSDTAETVTLVVLQAVIGLTNIDGANLIAYRSEIVKSNSATLADAAALQTVIDRTNASVTAFEVVTMAALTNNASNVTEAVLTDIIDLTFDPTNLSSYQSAIAKASDIATLGELQTLINDVDASVTAFALVQTAAPSNDASNITVNVLAYIIDLNVDDTHIQGYQAKIAAAASIDTIAALQALLTEVDESEFAFEQVQAAASSGDATAVTATLLGRILNLTSDASHIAEYKNHIEAQSRIDSVADLQIVLTEVDDSFTAFELVQTAASTNNVAAVTDAVLSDILNLTHVSANALAYQEAIAAETSIADVLALQALIDSVDASVVAFAAVQAAATSSDASAL